MRVKSAKRSGDGVRIRIVSAIALELSGGVRNDADDCFVGAVSASSANYGSTVAVSAAGSGTAVARRAIHDYDDCFVSAVAASAVDSGSTAPVSAAGSGNTAARGAMSAFRGDKGASAWWVAFARRSARWVLW